MRGLLRRLFERWSGRSSRSREPADAKNEADVPQPSTAWSCRVRDDYGQGQVLHADGGMVHLFVDDGELVEAMAPTH